MDSEIIHPKKDRCRCHRQISSAYKTTAEPTQNGGAEGRTTARDNGPREPERTTGLALVSLVLADWWRRPLPRSLLSPIGCRFPPLLLHLLRSRSHLRAEMAAGGGGGSLSGSASTWPLQRYGRFLPPTDGDEEQTASSWQVFESNEESGHLILTIVVSGHFFISRGRTVLNECRMFRVQFGGDSKQQMLEHCCNCVQKLAEYVPVQVTDDQSQNLCHSLSGGSQAEDAEQVLHVVSKQEYVDAKTGKRATPLFFLLQSVLKQKFELPLVYRHSVWSAQELGPFIRLCLMDQNFPAFVEDVEKELKKITGRLSNIQLTATGISAPGYTVLRIYKLKCN
uniref:REC114 meiotic recombination protein n=1 Tax=Anas platyrhynchos TaxID=8839 RepID=A0A8B9SJU7_ANAPL